MFKFLQLFTIVVVSGVRLYAQCGPIGLDPLADKTCWLLNGTPQIMIKSGAQIGGTLWPTLIQAQSFFSGYSEVPPKSPLWITAGTDNHSASGNLLGCGHLEGCKVDFRIADQNWSSTATDSVSQFIIMNPGASFSQCRSDDNAPKWTSITGISGGSIFAMEKSAPPYPPCAPYKGAATAPHWDFLTSLQQITTPWDGTAGLSVEVGQTASVSPTAYGTQGQIPMQPGMFEYNAPENGEFGDPFANIDSAGNITGLNEGSFQLYVSAGSDCGFGQAGVPLCIGIIDVVGVTVTANNPPGGGPKCVVGQAVPQGGCWNWDSTIGGWVWNPGTSGTGGNNPPGNPPNGGAICPSAVPCWQWDPTANSGAGAWILVVPNCGSCPPTVTSPTTTPVTSADPNAISGPPGVGAAQYISGVSPIGYQIYFENEPTATAATDQVVITDQIDLTRFDLATLTLGPITFPGYPGVLPPSAPLRTLGQFSTQVSLTTSNLLVNVTASLNSTTGLLTWTLQAIDPNTGLPPADPSLGILPPGGNGSVSFTARLLPSLATGTVVSDQATVIFDANAPISTAVWSNTLDLTRPVSRVTALPSTESAASFVVSWSGTDIGSGIQSYTIYVSDSGGPYGKWLTQTPNTNATFIGNINHTYSFYSTATDFAGNTEAAKTSPDTSTSVVVPCAGNASASFAITRGGFRLNHATGQFTQSVTVQNTSSAAISGPISIVLDNLSSNASLAGGTGITACNAPLNSQFINLSSGSLAAGASSAVTLTFTDPSQAGITYSTRMLTGAGAR